MPPGQGHNDGKITVARGAATPARRAFAGPAQRLPRSWASRSTSRLVIDFRLVYDNFLRSCAAGGIRRKKSAPTASRATVNMMMHARAALLAIFVVTGVAPWSPVSAAQELQTGNDLLTACRLLANDTEVKNDGDATAGDPLHLGICFGEIEALNWLAPGVPDPNLRSCVPADTTTAQMAKVIVQYLGLRPERLREPFEGLALEALAHTWPCSRQGGWLATWLEDW
jgi:Rap1a immunity proteins